MTDLGTLGGTSLTATAISIKGEVVGYSKNAAGIERAFSWRKGKLTELASLGTGETYARSINSAGTIVGSSIDANGAERPVVWNTKHHVKEIEGFELYKNASAEYISDSGDIIGLTRNRGASRARLFVNHGNKVTDLGTMWYFTYTVKINVFGDIAANGNARTGSYSKGYILNKELIIH